MNHSLHAFSCVCLLGLISACYIDYCGHRSKRSEEEAPPTQTTQDLVDFEYGRYRRCPICGPNNHICFGDNICCSEEDGSCLETGDVPEVCREEAKLLEPCGSGWKTCGERGQCAYTNMCCAPEMCERNETCVR